PAHPVAPEPLAGQALRPVLPRPRRAQATAQAGQTGLGRTGERRLAAPGRSAQPGAATQPVPPPNGALAGSRPGPVSGGTGLPSATGPVLRTPAHAPQPAPPRRAQRCPQNLWITL